MVLYRHFVTEVHCKMLECSITVIFMHTHVFVYSKLHILQCYVPMYCMICMFADDTFRYTRSERIVSAVRTESIDERPLRH